MSDNEIPEQKNSSEAEKLGKIALKLFTFLQRCHINTNVGQTPNELFSWTFTVGDMTDTAESFGLNFSLNMKDVENVQNDDASIEKFCFQYVVNIGNALMLEKASRLLEHNQPETKSRIILP